MRSGWARSPTLSGPRSSSTSSALTAACGLALEDAARADADGRQPRLACSTCAGRDS